MPSKIVFLIPRKLVLWSIFCLSIIATLFILTTELRNRGKYFHSETMKKRNFNRDDLDDIFFTRPYCHKRPYLLTLIASAPNNFQRRSAIRRTWGRHSLQRLEFDLSSRVIFMMGQSLNFRLNKLVKNEQISAGDILIGNYQDTYRNLTLKTMHGMKWAYEYCSPSYLLKTDDDCFVNVAVLLKFLSRFNRIQKGLYVGHVNKKSEAIRDPTSPLYVDLNDYPYTFYPPYVCGAGYILSTDVLELLINSFDKFRPFPNEDAYVGTILRYFGVKPIHSSRFSIQNGPWQLCNFLYLMIIHKISAEQQRQFQTQSNTALIECSSDDFVDGWN